MQFSRGLNKRLWQLSLLALCVVAGASSAFAQKKGGGGSSPPGPAPGTIYFSGWVSTSGNEGSYTGMSMKGDGAEKQYSLGYGSTPSFQRHSGSRWFLYGDYDYDGPVDEWGIPLHYEVYAVSDTNQWIQLTADPNVHWSGDPYQVAWSKDDSFVSFAGWEFTGVGDEVSGGLYTIQLDWSLGTPLASAPTRRFGAQAYWFYDLVGTVNVSQQDWSPSGNAVLFHEENSNVNGTTYVADLSGGGASFLSLGQVWSAAWSPLGNRIAYSNGEIWTIKPDGTDPVRLTLRTQSKTETRSQATPSWSPDGAFLAYTEAAITKSNSKYSILRIPSAGGSSVNLTSDLIKASSPKWRP
jgi:hypothetical protein